LDADQEAETAVRVKRKRSLLYSLDIAVLAVTDCYACSLLLYSLDATVLAATFCYAVPYCYIHLI
jgi:hypothetical protein